MNCRMNLNKWQICEPVFWPFYSSLYVTRFSGSRTKLNERHELHSCKEMSNQRFYKNCFIGASFSVEILVFFFEKCCANDSNWNWIGRECKCWFKNRKTTSTTFFLVFVGNSGIRTWSLNVIVFFLFLSLSLFHFLSPLVRFFSLPLSIEMPPFIGCFIYALLFLDSFTFKKTSQTHWKSGIIRSFQNAHSYNWS